MTPKLTNEIEQAVEQNHGFMQLEGQRSSYVVISIDAYREMMGVGSDSELAESLQAIEQGLADIQAGRTRPFRDVLSDLG